MFNNSNKIIANHINIHISRHILLKTTLLLAIFFSPGRAHAWSNHGTIIKCKEDQTLENVTNAINDDDRTTIISFERCPLPKESYFNVLARFGMNGSLIKSLTLNYTFSKTKLNATHFKNLNLTVLNIISGDQAISTLMPDFLDSSPYLDGLSVFNVLLPPLPKTSFIKRLYLHFGASFEKLGSCTNLETLVLVSWKISLDDWLSSCLKLTDLTLMKMSDTTVFSVVRSTKQLKHLKIIQCNIKALPRGFFDNIEQDLISLDLSWNNLQHILVINPLPSLLDLNLGHNLLGSGNGFYFVSFLLRQTPMLRKLILISNENFDMCNRTIDIIPHLYNKIKHPLLSMLLLDKTNTTNLCIDFGALPSLRFLGLAGNFRLHPVIKELIVSRRPLQIVFTDSSYTIKNVQFSKHDHDTLREIYAQNYFIPAHYGNNTANTIFITLDAEMELDCDCNHAFLARAVKAKYISARQAHCISKGNHTNLDLMPWKTLECDKFICGNKTHKSPGCDCRRSWEDQTVSADCRGRQVDEIPYVENLTELFAPNSRIHTLRVQDLPETLMFLDLTNNWISRLDAKQANAVFSNAKRRMKLSGNPIVCDCDNRAFILEMQEHHKQIDDYDNVMCAEGERAVKDILMDELCAKIQNGVLIASLTVFGLIWLAVVIGNLYYRFRKMIHILLYAKGWCLCCIKEDDIDSDRAYDAFVSFCHPDETLISEELVPKLEERGFKICVHYRDWAPGELIVTQMVQSIETSRRTIVVLSKSFVNSMWGMLEFQTAHVRALKEGIPRVILVVIDDVIDGNELRGDLRSYISTNTYVCWNDPWFWEKLTYAMPRFKLNSV